MSNQREIHAPCLQFRPGHHPRFLLQRNIEYCIASGECVAIDGKLMSRTRQDIICSGWFFVPSTNTSCAHQCIWVVQKTIGLVDEDEVGKEEVAFHWLARSSKCLPLISSFVEGWIYCYVFSRLTWGPPRVTCRSGIIIKITQQASREMG